MDFLCLGGPGWPGDPSKMWGAKPPTFLRGLPAARGRPGLPKSRIFPPNLATPIDPLEDTPPSPPHPGIVTKWP